MPTPAVVVVIGASSGIGVSAALAFAGRGDHVVLASRSRERLEAIAGQCRRRGASSATAVVTDVTDEASVGALFERVVAEHTAVDVVVHTATVMAYGTVESLPADVFTTAVDTAIRGTFYVARASLRCFRPRHRGTLVIVNSLLGAIVAPDMAAYVTGKWGQAGLIRALQLETRDERNIHVCSVSPGGVNTPIYSQAANVTGRTAQPPIPIDPPEKVARAIVRCTERPRARVSVGIANPVIVLGFRRLPQLFDLLVGPLLRFASLTKQPSTPSVGNVFEPTPAGEAEHGPWTHRWKLPPR